MRFGYIIEINWCTNNIRIIPLYIPPKPNPQGFREIMKYFICFYLNNYSFIYKVSTSHQSGTFTRRKKFKMIILYLLPFSNRNWWLENFLHIKFVKTVAPHTCTSFMQFSQLCPNKNNLLASYHILLCLYHALF